jgi:GDP-4-dehydro-6-deoxy-D-mannose reductase
MTLRILITGARGFVGPYVVAALRETFGQEVEIFSSSRTSDSGQAEDPLIQMDVTDATSVHRVVAEVRPTHVLHLAGLSSIPAAVANADLAWRVHLFGALNVAQAIKECVPDSVLLYVGTGQVYGASAQSGRPLDERTILAPTNVYTASKAAADLALGALATAGLNCIRFRPFNHTGPRQSEDFALPSFAMQIARIMAGQQVPIMRVGNLLVERDFLDVRDVAAAYVRAMLVSREIVPGTILNIASGISYRMQDLLMQLIALSGAQISVETDQRRTRSNDVPRFVGDATRAREMLGWQPRHSFEETLRDILGHAERTVTCTLAASR